MDASRDGNKNSGYNPTRKMIDAFAEARISRIGTKIKTHKKCSIDTHDTPPHNRRERSVKNENCLENTKTARQYNIGGKRDRISTPHGTQTARKRREHKANRNRECSDCNVNRQAMRKLALFWIEKGRNDVKERKYKTDPRYGRLEIIRFIELRFGERRRRTHKIASLLVRCGNKKALRITDDGDVGI